MSIISHKMFVDSMNKQFDGRPNNSYKPPKATVHDEIHNLKKQLLESLKRDTSISSTNHMIDVVSNIDTDDIKRLYFHICNMSYGEYHALQQDCYGTIDKEGLVELYKSREPNTETEAFSEYSDEEKRRVDEIKNILETNREKMQTETINWNEKNFFQKLGSKFQGKEPKGFVDLKELLSNLPKKFVEKGKSFKDSIKATPNISNNKEANNLEKNINEKDSGGR